MCAFFATPKPPAVFTAAVVASDASVVSLPSKVVAVTACKADVPAPTLKPPVVMVAPP